MEISEILETYLSGELLLNVLLKTVLKFDSVMKHLSAGSNTSDRIWDLPVLLFDQKSLQKFHLKNDICQPIHWFKI